MSLFCIWGIDYSVHTHPSIIKPKGTSDSELRFVYEMRIFTNTIIAIKLQENLKDETAVCFNNQSLATVKKNIDLRIAFSNEKCQL